MKFFDAYNAKEFLMNDSNYKEEKTLLDIKWLNHITDPVLSEQIKLNFYHKQCNNQQQQSPGIDPKLFQFGGIGNNMNLNDYQSKNMYSGYYNNINNNINNNGNINTRIEYMKPQDQNNTSNQSNKNIQPNNNNNSNISNTNNNSENNPNNLTSEMNKLNIQPNKPKPDSETNQSNYPTNQPNNKDIKNCNKEESPVKTKQNNLSIIINSNNTNNNSNNSITNNSQSTPTLKVLLLTYY